MSSVRSHRPLPTSCSASPREQAWEILDALQHLCDDPNLVALKEGDSEDFIVAAGYAIAVTVGDDSVSVLALRRVGAS